MLKSAGIDMKEFCDIVMAEPEKDVQMSHNKKDDD